MRADLRDETMALGEQAARMITALQALSDDETALTRLYLSNSHKQAIELVKGWMVEAGLDVYVDAMGTVRGRLSPVGLNDTPRKTLLVGSHIDTVRNAGAYDGTLGVICGILAARELKKSGQTLPFDVEVLAFGDEEGVRFPTTLSSSSAVAGVLIPAELDVEDKDGISVRHALSSFGLNGGEYASCAYRPEDVLGYLEVHIEQGPCLEAEGLALGIVSSIAGSSRYRVEVTGMAGHAGTVPMPLRRDALVAASELIGAIEQIALDRQENNVVATVGELEVLPGAVNVIPSCIIMSLDIRAASDAPRIEAVDAVMRDAARIGAKRGLSISLTHYHTVDTTACSEQFQACARDAFVRAGIKPYTLMSGAGHDGQVMAKLTEIGMLFVRCRGGISHNPLEHVDHNDMGVATTALIQWITRIAETKGSNDEGRD